MSSCARKLSLSLSLPLTDAASGLFAQIAQEDTGPMRQKPRGHSSPSVLTSADRGLYTEAFVGACAPLEAGATAAAWALV